MDAITKRRTWRSRTSLRRVPQTITRAALHRTPDGKRKRKSGTLRTTWRGTVESEIKATQHSWGSLTRLAQDRQKRRDFLPPKTPQGAIADEFMNEYATSSKAAIVMV